MSTAVAEERLQESSYTAHSLKLVGENVVTISDDLNLYYFDDKCADKWVNWFERYMTHTEGHLKGQRIKLMPFWRGAIRRLFGWKKRDTGLRRYNTAFWFVPRKNAKTLTTAGIALGLIAIDNEPGAKVFVSASTEDQAKKMFQDCVEMVTQPWLNDEGEEIHNPLTDSFIAYEDHIKHIASGSMLFVITANAAGKTGKNVHAAIIDEYHEQPDTKLKNVLRTGSMARRQPLLIMITTAGRYNPESPCFIEYLDCRKHLKDPSKRPAYFGLIFEASTEMDPGSRETWAHANPGWGLSVIPDTMQGLWDDVQDKPQDKDEFLQFNLNLWVQTASRYVPMDVWQELIDDYARTDLYGKVCYGGLDLGGAATSENYIPDMSALVLLFPDWVEREVEDENGAPHVVIIPTYKMLNWYWTPEGYKGKAQEAFRRFIDAGEVECTRGTVADYGLMRERIKMIGKRFKIKELLIDDWHANEMTSNLQNKDKFTVTRLRWGYRAMAAPTERFQELVLAGDIRHNDNQTFKWNLENARTVPDKHYNILISKQQSIGKIDGVQAGLCALRGAMDAVPPKQIRIYSI